MRRSLTVLRTLRAKLLIWYSVVLLTVLATFTAVAVWSVWRSSLRDLDTRLGAMASRLARAVNADAAGRYEVNLAEDDFAGFGAAADAPYYAIWSDDGALIDRSDPQLDISFPGGEGVRTQGGRREVVVRGNHGGMVLVGQSLAQTRGDVWSAVAALSAAGAIALLLASLGGWFLAGRALAPIGRIAQTAEAMSVSNLGTRVDVGHTEDELGRVAVALNRAFDRLQEAFERQTRFTADASHELRTPLASQLAELEWALARPRSAGEYEAALQVCMTAARRMRAIVEGLLTLARADGGAVQLSHQPVELGSLLREVAEGMRGSAAAKGITIHVEDGEAVVDGDSDRLRELMSNLVLNAVQHSSRGGIVNCRVSADGDTTTVDVADSGAGIDAEDLPHVFERFYRANKARSRAAGGAGLGLAISKWIVESHGGRIRCESESGRGTRFTVEFPA